ncbi:TPM domain-containing protein [Spirosoma rhododendri]|uniref:TPM domain-containing protein n=1 Tax=Spirosoma rhododendri TaxID=2728024 RepID=A0A7L5DLH2_9BACT|nr:TPM domain-containing protein [Spirosoma rhododendri]QJD78382.1 TPM domain-containing protein [Spirosoma rhododendri]
MNVRPYSSFLRLLRGSLLLVSLALLALAGYAQTGSTADSVIPARPNPPRLVNDFAGALSAQERARLEQKLDAYNDSTSTQITIVIVKSTEPYPIGDFAFQVGRKWGVGQSQKNNGLVLAWATQTRKVYIATGYGLEGAIPDAIAKRIISNDIVPAFKEQRYFDGLDAATTEIIQRAQGEYKADPRSSDDDGGLGGIFVLIVIGVIIFIIFANRNRGGGGSNRNRGGGFFPPVFFPTSTYSGWGGSSGGGGFGGGGGGGFGGFGGGSFGGGGAGGDY